MERQVKILMQGDHGEVETLWADVLGGDLYAVDNLPWYAYGVSLGDVVEARPGEAGELRLTRVVRKSGNRTLRVILEAGEVAEGMTPQSARLLDRLRERGCSYEGANRLFIAVNVPPMVELSDVVGYLTASGFDWEYADPTYEDLFPDLEGQADQPDA